MPDGYLVTPHGRIEFTLFVDEAPLSARALEDALRAGSWTDGEFHRVVRADNDHGDPRIDVVQAAARVECPSIEHESTAVTGLRHVEGTLSLARGEAGTASGAHVFICVSDAPGLDHGATRAADGLGFAAVGRVTAGMDVVRAIHAADCVLDEEDSYTSGQVLVEPVRIIAAQMHA